MSGGPPPHRHDFEDFEDFAGGLRMSPKQRLVVDESIVGAGRRAGLRFVVADMETSPRNNTREVPRRMLLPRRRVRLPYERKQKCQPN
jgi:hypothetical protein